MLFGGGDGLGLGQFGPVPQLQQGGRGTGGQHDRATARHRSQVGSFEDPFALDPGGDRAGGSVEQAAGAGAAGGGIAADHIVARGNTLTGSIGVIMEYPDLTGLIDRIGVSMQTVRSSELKAEPSPFRPTSPAARAQVMASAERHPASAPLFIVNPLNARRPMDNLFATHPAVENRIAALEAMAAEMGQRPGGPGAGDPFASRSQDGSSPAVRQSSVPVSGRRPRS